MMADSGAALRECYFRYIEGSFELQDEEVVNLLDCLKNGQMPSPIQNPSYLLYRIAAIIPTATADVHRIEKQTPTEAHHMVARLIGHRLVRELPELENLRARAKTLDASRPEDAAAFVAYGYTEIFVTLFNITKPNPEFDKRTFLSSAADILSAETQKKQADRNQKSPMSPFTVYTRAFRFYERYLNTQTEAVLPNADRAVEQAAGQALRHEETLLRRERKRKEKSRKSSKSSDSREVIDGKLDNINQKRSKFMMQERTTNSDVQTSPGRGGQLTQTRLKFPKLPKLVSDDSDDAEEGFKSNRGYIMDTITTPQRSVKTPADDASKASTHNDAPQNVVINLDSSDEGESSGLPPSFYEMYKKGGGVGLGLDRSKDVVRSSAGKMKGKEVIAIDVSEDEDEDMVLRVSRKQRQSR